MSPDTLYTHWVHSYLVCSCYIQSVRCMFRNLVVLPTRYGACLLLCSIVLRLYCNILYVVGNKQARCTVLLCTCIRKAAQLLSWVCYCMFYESTVCTIDFYKPGCTTHSIYSSYIGVLPFNLLGHGCNINSYIDLACRITFETSVPPLLIP